MEQKILKLIAHWRIEASFCRSYNPTKADTLLDCIQDIESFFAPPMSDHRCNKLIATEGMDDWESEELIQDRV